MTMGMSDVAGSSFNQTGPITTTVKPLDQSMLTSTQTAIVPWQFTVGEHVKKNIGTVGTPNLVSVVGFSRTEIEAIFSRNVTDWTQLGLVTDVASPGTPDATSPITLCLRAAGSGSKAAFDATVMKDATETPFGSTDLTQSADGVYFGASTQDVQDCLKGNPTASGGPRPAHPRGIGYVDADVSVATTPAYPVKLNGVFANDTSLTDPKINVKCGKYLYWAGERMNTRNYSDPGITASITALANVFITNASSSSTVALLPAGAFWVAQSDMYVFKNADPGPVLWSAGAHSTCAQ
jgi:ABC-type phosphate transport system substrate-binding protein